MRILFAVTLLAAIPLFSQNDNPCLSAEQRYAEFRAEHKRPGSGNPSGNSFIPSRTTAEECLASARGSNPEPPPGGPVSFYKLTHKIPGKARNAFNKGVMAGNAGDIEAAELHYRNAIKLDPGYLEAHNNLGSLLMKSDSWKEALEELTIASQLDPASSAVHSNLGVIYLRLRDFAKAEQEGRLASSLNPKSGKPHYVVGMAMLYQRKDSRLAKAHLEKAIEELPGTAEIITKLGL